MKKKLLIIGVIIGVLLVGCTKEENEEEYIALMKDNEYVILDVRTKEEYDEGHVVGAKNMPYDEIKEEELDKDKLIFVYCKSGVRSKKAYDTLINLGFNVYDLGAYQTLKLDKE